MNLKNDTKLDTARKYLLSTVWTEQLHKWETASDLLSYISDESMNLERIEFITQYQYVNERLYKIKMINERVQGVCDTQRKKVSTRVLQ